MENILKIIYDKSINNKVLKLNDIEKILELLIVEKNLNDYILNINVHPIRGNNLASYSTYTKQITIYVNKVEQMITNIENSILNANDFEKSLFKNLSILQILLHEVEHANQYKIAYNDNSLEAFIIRLSYLIENGYNELLYEYCPEERLAEIKSFYELKNFLKIIENKLEVLPEIIETEKLKRLLSGYHYKDSKINVPIVDYFTLGSKKYLLHSLKLEAYDSYTLNERLKYGFAISAKKYGNIMSNVYLSLNKNFNNRTNIK
jgi:hypothetical protein